MSAGATTQGSPFDEGRQTPAAAQLQRQLQGAGAAGAPRSRVDVRPEVVPPSASATGDLSRPATPQWLLIWRSFAQHKGALAGLIIVGSIALASIFLPFVLPWKAHEIDLDILAASGPSLSHPLGTDTIGRDVLARLLAAGRISLTIGFTVALAGAAIGSTVGVMAGYFGGRTDTFLMWLVNVVLTLPGLPLLIALAALIASPTSALGALFGSVPEWMRIAIVLVALGWAGVSRVVRSQVLSVKEQEFVEASQALGASSWRVMFVHILPNCLSVIVVFTTLAVAGAIMAESVLSFLGVGVNPPTATWGNMLNEARDLFTLTQYWWLTWFPALMIFLTVLSVNFIGDGLRDAFDPKSQAK